MAANSTKSELMAQWLILAVYFAVAIGRESFAVTMGVELLLAISSLVILYGAPAGASLLGAIPKFLGRKATIFLIACLYLIALSSINFGKLPAFQRAAELVRSPVSAQARIQPLYSSISTNSGKVVYQFNADSQIYDGQGVSPVDVPASDLAFTTGIVYYLRADPNVSSLDPAADFQKAALSLIFAVIMLQSLAAALVLELSKHASTATGRVATA